MIEIDYTNRFKKSVQRLSVDQQKLVAAALKLFRSDPSHKDLDFKKRTGSKYFTIRADIRIRIAMTREGDRVYLLHLAGNHDDINSMDRQKR